MARQRGILEHVYEILKEAGGATDVALIVEKLRERGVVSGPDKVVKHHTYTRIFMDISNKSGESRFRRCGRGVFCLAEHVGSDGEAVFGSGITTTGFSGERRCGNCNYAEYNGVQELIQVTAYCTNAEKSQRYYTRRDAQPCDHWRRRQTDKVIKDKNTRDKQRDKVHIFNLKHRGKIGRR